MFRSKVMNFERDPNSKKKTKKKNVLLLGITTLLLHHIDSLPLMGYYWLLGW